MPDNGLQLYDDVSGDLVDLTEEQTASLVQELGLGSAIQAQSVATFADLPASAHLHDLAFVREATGTILTANRKKAGFYQWDGAAWGFKGNQINTVTKADVGLGNVDNTADADKPISTEMQTALNAKSDSPHQHTIDDVTGLQAALDAKPDNAPHSIINIDLENGYAEKRRGNGTTYIVRLNDGLLNQGGTWANRTTLNYI